MPGKLNRILVVDSSEVARTIIVRILSEDMPETEIFTSGTVGEAQKLLEKYHFDLVTTSLMLPDQDGLELSRYIRASREHHYTPTIVVSGDADSRLLREGFAAGVTDYFDKSLGYRAFVEFIKDFTQRKFGAVGHVLYVEDSRSTAALVTRLMEKHGLQVTHTTHAEQALAFLHEGCPHSCAGSETFDIVMTDFYLAGKLSGGDLLHALRAKFHFSQQEMPVLVLTSAEDFEKQVELFHAGANDFVQKPVVEEVLMARIRSLLFIKQQFYALKRQSEQLHRQAITDSLTRVNNRRYLLDHGEAFLAHRDHQPVAALLIDIDHFKKVNDNLGHLAGDRVLQALASLLSKRISGESVLVRFGGEEFAALIPRCSDKEAKLWAEMVRTEVESSCPAEVPITISVGLATNASNPRIGLTQLINNADKALYAAKAQGRNLVCA